MSNSIPAQHPAVVLRSSYRQVRTLLALAALVIVGLTSAVAVLAIHSASTPAAHSVRAVIQARPVPAVAANPDQLGPQPSVPRPGPVANYPGHF
jgi:hypothetical protein